MKKNTDPRVDTYIAAAAGFAKPVLRRIRKVIHQACPEAEEAIKWSFPTFVYRGKILCGMAAFKGHCTFGFWHQDMAAIMDAESPGARGARGGLFECIRSLEELPPDRTLAGYVQKAVALHESGAPARPRPVRKRTALRVPRDLAAALQKHRTAAATFAALSPSHRREYIEWLGEAKRDETRQKRLTTTLEWLAQGKTRNWKYERC